MNEKVSHIAFGSGLERSRAPISSRIALRVPEKIAPGPTSYDTDFLTRMARNSMTQDVRSSKRSRSSSRSRKGRTVPINLHQIKTPAPNAYSTGTVASVPTERSSWDCKPSRARLNRNSADRNTLPGPGTYSPESTKLRKEVKEAWHLGMGREVVPSVNLRCLRPDLEAVQKCRGCGQIPTGDYWVVDIPLPKGDTEKVEEELALMDYDVPREDVFCRPCYSKAAMDQTYRNLVFLSRFRKVRGCSSYHVHGTTDKSVRLVSTYNIKERKNREAYLSLYV